MVNSKEKERQNNEQERHKRTLHDDKASHCQQEGMHLQGSKSF